MLFSLSHGQHAVREAAPPAEAAALPLSAVAEATARQPGMARPEMAMADGPPDAHLADRRRAAPAPVVPAPVVPAGEFHYYAPAGAGLPERADMPGLLDALADTMVEPDGAALAANSRIPPIFTYLGQFIDHDITANTDRDGEVSVIAGAIAPLPRAEVTARIANLRDGSLGLDSLYGDTPGQGPFATKLAGLMRHPSLRAKMRLGTPSTATDRVPLPVGDDATDLLRLGFLVDRGDVTLAELEALEPAALRDNFLKDGTPRRARAVIGDGRNDENLIVAQLHVLFLRLHNTLVDRIGAGAGAGAGAAFEEARRLTRWHYQWLVLNAYLPTVCDPAVVGEVIAAGAPLYAQMLAAHPAQGARMPMPIEFSVAAFRFGHSMVRGAYDHNRFFGKPVPPAANIIPIAPFGLLFAFTGNGEMNGDPAEARLPRNWVIEWERWTRIDTANPGRSARKIDSNLAVPLGEMENEVGPLMTPEQAELFRRLARRNLRRGYRLNVPTAQACIDAVAAAGATPFRALTPEQLLAGSPLRTAAVEAGGFDVATPLWFYVLKEAEALGCGERLGPLGSHIVANTLVGLVANDPDSFMNAPGGAWSPAAFDAADPVDSIEDVARFVGML